MSKCTANALTFILVFLAASMAAADNTITFGPYVQNVTDQRAVVCWATLEGESIASKLGWKKSVRAYNVHERIFVGLEPNTRYEYDVFGDGSPEGSGHFTTFPAKAEPFTFVAFGDTRSGHKEHAKLAAHILKDNPLFVINTGDLVSNGLEMNDWESFFRVSGDLMRNIPYYPVLGNHEKDSPYYFDFFSLPGNERYYSFLAGDCFFLMLDTEGPDYPTPEFVKKENREEFWAEQNRDYMEQQKQWADKMLRLHRDAGYIFVCFHQPLISVKKSRAEDAKIRRAFWGGLFERRGVQVVLSGHDHHYHRAVSGGTHFVTTGGGGASLYDADAPQPETVKIAKARHYIRINVGEEQANLSVIDIDGSLIESFSVQKRSN